MIFVDKRPNFYLLCIKACLAKCLKRFLIVKALVGAFNKENRRLLYVGAFSYELLLLATYS